jgi:hypothetical protein
MFATVKYKIYGAKLLDNINHVSRLKAYHTNTTWFRACSLTCLANFGYPKVGVENLLPMNCYSYG